MHCLQIKITFLQMQQMQICKIRNLYLLLQTQITLKFRLMDIASRLRKFIDSIGVPDAQFADFTGLKRPTLSQILTGRNKKVSNEFVERLHKSFPKLNVLWLLFGEGNMTTDSNMQISESENDPIIAIDESKQSESEELNDRDLSSDYSMNSESNRGKTAFQQDTTSNKATAAYDTTDLDAVEEELFSNHSPKYSQAGKANNTPQAIDPQISHRNESTPDYSPLPVDKRKVKTIMVFFDDGSYQSFKPE